MLEQQHDDRQEPEQQPLGRQQRRVQLPRQQQEPPQQRPVPSPLRQPPPALQPPVGQQAALQPRNHLRRRPLPCGHGDVQLSPLLQLPQETILWRSLRQELSRIFRPGWALARRRGVPPRRPPKSNVQRHGCQSTFLNHSPAAHSGPEMPPSLRTRQKWTAIWMTITNGSASTCNVYHLISVTAPICTPPSSRNDTSLPTKGDS